MPLTSASLNSSSSQQIGFSFDTLRHCEILDGFLRHYGKLTSTVPIQEERKDTFDQTLVGPLFGNIYSEISSIPRSILLGEHEPGVENTVCAGFAYLIIPSVVCIEERSDPSAHEAESVSQATVYLQLRCHLVMFGAGM